MRLDKLEALIGADHASLKLVTPIMGLDGTERYGALDLTPAQQRAQTMQALAGLLVRQAAEKPVLMVFEDLHWVDPTSQELLDTLLDQITDQPIMILATARPTFEYGFGGHPIVTKFALNRLGKDQIGAIVSKLTDGKALPDEIMEIIARRTDGVPLFVEELTKTILESGALNEAGERYVLDGPLSAIRRIVEHPAVERNRRRATRVERHCRDGAELDHEARQLGNVHANRTGTATVHGDEENPPILELPDRSPRVSREQLRW